MAPQSEQSWNDVLGAIQEREQAAKRRALVYTIVPAILAIALLLYSGNQIRKVASLRRDVSSLKGNVADLENQVRTANARVKDAEERLQAAEAKLKDATNLGKYVHPIDLMDVKHLYSAYPRAAEILGEIIGFRDRGVVWRLGGRSPEEGFDSPSFAAFILNKATGLPSASTSSGGDLVARARQLWDQLPPAPQPQVGDLCFYATGYTMFFFRDSHSEPFVIGMTPFGIAALRPDFAKLDGCRQLRRQ